MRGKVSLVSIQTTDRVCTKRLRPLIRVLLPALERHGKLVLDEALRGRLVSVSAATIDRKRCSATLRGSQGFRVAVGAPRATASVRRCASEASRSRSVSAGR